MDEKIGQELHNLMDALVAIKLDLECEPGLEGEAVVLPAAKARDACEAIKAASQSAKELASTLGAEKLPDDRSH